MKRSLIVAISTNGVIGNRNKLPWKISEDLIRFKNITMGHPIIMGRRTFQAIGKSLPGRKNIVVTTNPDFKANEVETVSTLLEAITVAEQSDSEEIFVIGGQTIYEQALPFCNRIYLTIVEKDYVGDSTFHFSANDWRIVQQESYNTTIPHRFLILEKERKMAQWLTLERLNGNDLPKPAYKTPTAAGIDFSACLTRPFYKEKEDKPYLVVEEIRMPVVPDAPPLPTPSQRVLSIAPGETLRIPLGFKCSFDPSSFLMLAIRSSMGISGLRLANGVGIVDSDYRGELFAAVHNRTLSTIAINHGDRIVQGILIPFHQAIIQEGATDATERGEGGFGSTGINDVAKELSPLPGSGHSTNGNASEIKPLN